MCTAESPKPLSLPEDPTILQEMIRELLKQLAASRQNEEQLRRKLDELVRKLFGRKSERLDPNQLTLIDLAALGIAVAPEPVEEAPAAPRKPVRTPHGRRRLPADLPRRRVEHVVPEEERRCPCCGDAMQPIREEISEQLDYEPASLVILEHVRPVYACHKGCDEATKIARKPAQPIEKGLPGPGLLAQVITSKYCDHLPLHRQEAIFRRQGVEISRSTMCDWIRDSVELLEPVTRHMKEELLRSKVVATDETPITVLDRGGGTHKGRLWIFIGHDDDYPWDVFDYTPTREGDGPKSFLEGYRGFLQADAYSGYDAIFADGNVIEVGCWMHARRYFYKASDSSPQPALEALAMIRRLYKIEQECKAFDSDDRKSYRQEHAAPLLDTFKDWLGKTALVTPPKSPLNDALRYATNQWEALTRYTKQGWLEIDNGRSERGLRQIAVGRNNWTFAGNDNGGLRAAVLYTLISSCRRHHVDPFRYLRDLLQRLPTHPADRLYELTPLAWRDLRKIASGEQAA